MAKQETLRKTIISNVKEFPTNIHAALTLSAGQHRTTYGAAQYQYYGMKDNKSIRDSVPCFITQSPKGIMINTKRTPVKKATKRTLKLWNEPINITEMDDASKIAMVDMIFR